MISSDISKTLKEILLNVGPSPLEDIAEILKKEQEKILSAIMPQEDDGYSTLSAGHCLHLFLVGKAVDAYFPFVILQNAEDKARSDEGCIEGKIFEIAGYSTIKGKISPESVNFTKTYDEYQPGGYVPSTRNIEYCLIPPSDEDYKPILDLFKLNKPLEVYTKPIKFVGKSNDGRTYRGNLVTPIQAQNLTEPQPGRSFSMYIVNSGGSH